MWERIKIPEPATPHDERERPFTDEEVRKLLTGPASPPMHDLMMIAALTGARLEAIVDLRARDCEAGLFTFKPQKKEKSARGVPIHSALVDLVARRTKGKSGADDLFPEYPVPKRSTSQRERSFRASNEFTEYRRSVGVEEVVPGRRRSLGGRPRALHDGSLRGAGDDGGEGGLRKGGEIAEEGRVPRAAAEASPAGSISPKCADRPMKALLSKLLPRGSRLPSSLLRTLTRAGADAPLLRRRVSTCQDSRSGRSLTRYGTTNDEFDIATANADIVQLAIR